MNGPQERIELKQEQAIAALLSFPTLQQAADCLQISELTLRRWLKNPTFRAAFLEARREILDAAVTRLHQICNEAIEALHGALKDEDVALRIRAAQLILAHAERGAEIFDLEARLALIEGKLKELSDGDQKPQPAVNPSQSGVGSEAAPSTNPPAPPAD